MRPVSNAPGQEYIAAGQQSYQMFNQTIILDRVMRQQGEDARSIRFRDVLNGLREGTITQNGYELLSSRVAANLDPAERSRFQDALQIYGTRAQVASHNVSILESRPHPAVKILAKHNCSAAKKGTDEQAEGLMHMQLH